jgi:hypothetical protein
MCFAIAVAWNELPVSLIERHGLADRAHDRGGEREVRFYWRAIPTLLPVWWEGQLQIVRWGNQHRSRSPLPVGGWTWQASIDAGRWADAGMDPVDVPATYTFAGGVWTRVRQGVRGLLVRDRDELVVYLICQPSTRYYRIMTRCDFQPVLVDEVI